MTPLNEVSMKQAVESAKADAAYLASCFASTAHGFTQRTPKALRKRYALECGKFADLLESPDKFPTTNRAAVPVEVGKFIDAVAGYLTQSGCKLTKAYTSALDEAQFSDAVKWNELLRWKQAALVIARAHFATLTEMPASAPVSYRSRAEATCISAYEFLGGIKHAELKTFAAIEIKNAIDRCRGASNSLTPRHPSGVAPKKPE